MASGNSQQKADILSAGTPAPDFTLHSTPDQTVSLAELRGQPFVLAFYPADWSPVCGDEVQLFNAVLPDIEELGARMLGVSVDGVWCHAAFAKARNLHFPLLADFEPKGEVARKFGVYREQGGVTERALFVVDDKGVVAWSYLSPIGVNPGADGVLRALESLRGRGSGVSGQARAAASPAEHAPGGEARP